MNRCIGPRTGGAENAGVEIAGVENAGAITYGKPSGKIADCIV